MMHGLYRTTCEQAGITCIAMINNTYIAGWLELPMPSVLMCSGWNRVLCEPPGSDIHENLERALPPGTTWSTWPLSAVLKGWLAYAEVELSLRDLVGLVGHRVDPTEQGWREAALELVKGSILPLEVEVDPPRVDRAGVACGHVRVGRAETFRELWPLGTLQTGYQQVLTGQQADQQCAGLECFADVPIAFFVENPGALAMVDWSVLGLVTGDTPGHIAMEVATIMPPSSDVARGGTARPDLQYAFVL
ncbi:hypothetical protein AB0J43_05995 [Nonomuraea fuscirosea]